jgi:hypothetical protein
VTGYDARRQKKMDLYNIIRLTKLQVTQDVTSPLEHLQELFVAPSSDGASC